MNLSIFNPLYDIESIFNSDFNGKFRNNDFMPLTDISENKDSFIIKAEIPGVDKKDVSIDIRKNILTISGHKVNENKDEKNHKLERYYGEFSRSFNLPDNTDTKKINARHDNGVFYITVPKSKEEETKLMVAID